MRFPHEIWVILTDLKRHKPLRAALGAILARTTAHPAYNFAVPALQRALPLFVRVVNGRHAWVFYCDPEVAHILWKRMFAPYDTVFDAVAEERYAIAGLVYVDVTGS